MEPSINKMAAAGWHNSFALGLKIESRNSIASSTRLSIIILLLIVSFSSASFTIAPKLFKIMTPPPPEAISAGQTLANNIAKIAKMSTIQGAPEIKTHTPIIGVLTEVLRDYKRYVSERHLHLVASYVKWLEMAGAQVIPILLNQNDAYYERIFNQTNGLLFPGGDNLLDPTKRTPMMVAARKLYNLAVASNDRGDYYPIWGTCLGMELLSVLTANRNVLESCHAQDVSLKMEIVGRGKMFAPSSYSNLDKLGTDYSKIIVDILGEKNLTYNFHKMCLTDQAFAKTKLDKFYRPLAYSFDKRNFKFIAIMEAIKYPFYGVQFHPEKTPFEFVVLKSEHRIPHSREAIAVSRYFADFFVTQAQLNGHRIDEESVKHELIYAYNPMYTALKRDACEQRYLFPYENERAQDKTESTPSNPPAGKQTTTSAMPSTSVSISNEEFMDYVPDSDEEATEDVSQAGRLGLKKDLDGSLKNNNASQIGSTNT